MGLAPTLATGCGLSALIALLAYSRRALSPSGVAGAILVGTPIYAFGGLSWWCVLITFFVLSSALSFFKKSRKQRVAVEKFDKGARRDLWQALANGGLGAVIAIGSVVIDSSLPFFAFVGVMATVNADTWATEIGVLSRRPPRLITTLGEVEAGTSGGISLLGLGATLAGGLVIGVAAFAASELADALGEDALRGAFGSTAAGALALSLAGLVGGLVGSLVDSLLGATVQVMYFSEARGKETERRLERDGTPNRYRRGLRWMTNDVVNFASSAVGGAVAAGLSLLLRG
jgi:uncharacterized protein (TIGR00297 family)